MGPINKHLPKTFSGEDINSIVYDAIHYIRLLGQTAESRNGPVEFITRSEMVMLNPKERYLNLEGRKSNIIQMMAETLWVMSGSGNIDPFLSAFLPRASNYSDDGVTWRGAYGPRMYAYGQLDDAVQAFVREGVNTRRSVVSIYNPVIDSSIGIQASSLDGSPDTKDLPCNDFMQLWADGDDNTLHLEVYQRSGDIIWGAGSINLFEFSFFLECMLAKINAATNLDLKLGTYCHRTTNLHFYSQVVGEQINSILSNNRPRQNVDTPTTGRVIISDPTKMKEHFQDIVAVLTKAISEEVSYDEIEACFTYEEASLENTTYVMAMTIASHLRGTGQPHISLYEHHPAMYDAIKASKFTKLFKD